MIQPPTRPPTSFSEVAGACLRALSEVLSYRAASWGKYELATWLAGPYRDATCAHEEARPDDVAFTGSEQSPRAELLVSDARVREVLREARAWVGTILRDGGGRFTVHANALLAKGRVVEIWEESGQRGVVPVSHERMRLEERILSLAVAYCMTYPQDLPRLAARAINGRTPEERREARTPRRKTDPPSGVRTRVDTIPMERVSDRR